MMGFLGVWSRERLSAEAWLNTVLRVWRIRRTLFPR